MVKKGKKKVESINKAPKINFTGAVAELMETAAETTGDLKVAYETGRKFRVKSGKERTPHKVGEILDRVQLFDKLNSPQFFPLDKIQTVLSLIKGPNTVLKFTGVEQLTDLFFCTLADLKLQQKVNLDNVSEIDLTACHNLTDNGMVWLALCFTKLQKINLSGCKLITEDGLGSLLKGCTELNTIDLTGTNVAILPRGLASLDVECGGCPILSPNLDEIKKSGLRMLEDPKNFERPEEMVQICVIRSSTASQSLVKLLAGKNPTGEEAVEYLPNLQMGKIKANVMETDKCVIDLFIHKRTAYVITYEGKDAKEVAEELFAIICHVLSKDKHESNAVFLLVGMTTEKGENCAKSEEVLKLVQGLADSSGKKIPRIKDVPLKGLDYTDQLDQVHKQMMAQSLGFIKCQAINVDTHKKAKDQPDLLQTLQKVAEIAINLCPSFKDIARPLYLYLTSNSVDNTLKNGAASMSKVPISIRKTMELHHILGNAVCISFLDGTNLAVRPDQLAVALCTVLKEGKQPNTTQLSMVDDDTPVHLQDDFQEMLQEKLTPIQCQAAMGLIIKLPIGHISSVYLPFKYLKTKCPVVLEDYFPGDPGPKVAVVTHTFTFHHPVDTIIIQRLAALCVNLRRPSAMWQYGIIMQDGYVDSLMLLSNNNGVYSLVVRSQTVIVSSKHSISWDMAWRQCLLYRLIAHYVLRKMGLSFDVTVQSKEPKAAHIQPVICRHKFEDLKDNPQPICMDCGLRGSASQIIWNIYEYMNPAHMNANMIYHQKEPNYKLCGCLLSPTKPDAAVYLTTEMKAYEQDSVKYTFLDCQSQAIKIALFAGFMQKCVEYNTKSGEVIVFNELGQNSVIGNGSPVMDGETVEIKFEPTTIKGNIMTNVFIIKTEMRVANCLLGNQSFKPCVTFVGDNKPDTLVMIHDHEPMVAANMSLEVGMRLEALDRLTPNLICVATIEKIDEKTGKILIHFDGWTNRYDYWTEFETPDLHPVGYMEENGHSLGTKNPQLQAPKGYTKQFTWETYCKEIGHLPVPYHLFSETQCDGTPRDRTDSVYDACDAGMVNQGMTENQGTLTASCKSDSNEASRIETMILRSCVVNPAVIQFFLDNSKFFVLLPRDLTINDLRHPSLTKLSQNKNINVHMLCPGLRSEILHFVNSAGIELEQFYPNFDCMESWPTFLFMCYLGLILQDDMLPQTIDKIMPSVSDTLKKDELQLIERGLQRVFYLYLLWLGLIQNVQKMSIAETSKVSDSIQKFYVDLANNSDALKQIQHNFHGFDGSSPMRCMGHHLSINLPQDTSESTLDQYKDYLQFLQKIDFHKHGMKELSGNFFSKFTRAEDLNLSENQLQKIPADINMASFLTHLNISKNEITSLPNEIAELKDTLLTLDISHNPLGDLPACVLKLTSLTQLHATNIGKVSSLRGIKYMKDLEVLCIGYNILESIPDELKDLPLVELDISGVPWFPNLISERINPTMSRFKSIVDQYIAFKQLPAGKLEEIFKSVDKDSNGTLENEELVMVNNIIMDMFPRFGKDQMVNPETGGMPKVVYQMTTLQKLTVEFHCLMEITDHIKHLIKLTAINFSNTTIQSLSPQAGQLNLREIHLQHCPSLKTPPKEVVRRGFNAVYGYLKRLSQGATSCRRTKLMMVGLGGAGKTSLVESLMSSYGTADLDYEEAITDGIDICQWNVPVKGEESIQFSVWDFAGQTVYYNTHQFFLSNRAVYMLVWNIRLGYEHAGLDFWLSSIACHAPKAPILIIGTHCDKVTKSSLPQQELKKAFPQIRDFYFVSSYTGEGISNLQNVLKTVALEQKYMGEKVPEAWLELERKIMKYREGPKKVDLLPWTEVEEEADTCGILDPVEMIQAIEFLHDLGSVIFFNTEFLRGYVVIYPQWIVDVMACIVTVHVGPIKEGKLLHKDMGVVWKKYPKNLHPWLLRLTEEFDLTFPLKDEEANLVPCLLPDTDTSYDWPTVKTDKGEKETKMIYTFKYLPAGLFNRAQVRLHGYSEGGKIWKKGMYLKKNNHIAVILQNSKSEVLARAQGYKPENILYLIHEVFEALIEESYAGVKYDFRIPCIECQNMNLTEPSMFAASRVYRAVELGAPFIQCDNMFHTLSIPELQALMPPDKSTDFDNHLRRSIQELQDINEDININVCFVFHSKNVPTTTEEKKDMVDPFQIMTDLRAHGFLVSFCDTPDTADLGTLTLSFKAAKVVIIGISDEFAADPQCKRLFIFVKETLRMPFLLVVLGNGKEWMKSDLALNISSEVYVKMNDIKRYDAKIKEMYEAIPRKLEANTEGEEIPRCFISYCWANSKSEVDKPGSRLKEGAVGWGDPRKLKHFLSKGGVSCWLDVERVGGKGLFEDIADGLRKAKIIVACVSDEYADSANCKMEFRFAACQLKIPIIIVVVGTGYTWERTEIGMLAVGNKYPKVNLQYENSSGLLDIMKMVQEKMPQESETKKGKSLEEQKEASFQEVLEITQRQFLRQCIQFADSMNVAHYPRLVVVDILHDKPLTKKLSTTEKREEENSECPTEQAEEPVVEDTPLESGGKKNKMCFRLLCEHEEGWHEVDTTIPFPSLTTEDEDEWLQGIAPYAARVLAVLKYTNLPLLCINTPQGKQLQQKYESVLTDGQEKNADFKDAYTKARETVMEQDKDRTCGGLRRCHLLNGKVRWLCEKHSQETGSKTERKYHSELSVKSKEGVSTPHITKRESQLANKNASAAKSPDPVQVQPQVFQMRQMQGVAKKNSHGQMKRQTSQACSVM